MVDPERVGGCEADKRRPAVVVSSDGANTAASRRGRGVVTVVPVTSNVQHILPFQVLLTAESCGLTIDSKAQAEQVRSVDVGRLGEVVGQVPEGLMASINGALRLHLGL